MARNEAASAEAELLRRAEEDGARRAAEAQSEMLRSGVGATWRVVRTSVLRSGFGKASAKVGELSRGEAVTAPRKPAALDGAALDGAALDGDCTRPTAHGRGS